MQIGIITYWITVNNFNAMLCNVFYAIKNIMHFL